MKGVSDVFLGVKVVPVPVEGLKALKQPARSSALAR